MAEKLKVDWEIADRLFESGCDGTQVAAHFGMHADTLYKRVEEERGMAYSAYKQLKRHKGQALIWAKQYEKAIKGDNVMLIWAGKQLCDQRENKEKEKIDNEVIKQFNTLMNYINNQQSTSKEDNNKTNIE